MTPDLLILEDDPDRTERFAAAAARLGLVPRVWRGAADMLPDLEPLLPFARLISLDHDPDPDPPAGTPDPGDGLDAARWLAARPPTCPVLVHTSNTLRGHLMADELRAAGWVVRRVAPVGDDWVEVDWFAAARRRLRRTRK